MPADFRLLMSGRQTAAILVALALSGPVAAQSFQGTFRGDGMVLTLQPSQDHYRGTLVFDGQFFAVEARAEEDLLSGSFSAEQGDFEFQASFAGEVLEFETNTVTYSLYASGKRPPVEEGAGGTDPAPEGSPVVEAPGSPPAESPEASPEPVEPPAMAEETLPSEAGVAEAEAPGAETEAVDAPVPAMPEPVSRDERLIGDWHRQKIAADTDRFVGEATAVTLAADGAYVLSGSAAEIKGSWKTEDRTLFLKAPEADAWRPCCRYRLVGNTLLLSFDDESRQLWHR